VKSGAKIRGGKEGGTREELQGNGRASRRRLLLWGKGERATGSLCRGETVSGKKERRLGKMTLTRGVGLIEKEREKRKGCRVDGLRLGWPSRVGSRAIALLDPGSAQLLCFFFLF
jgi:hypothetical protein